VWTTRRLQIGMLVLLAICFAQVGWWILDLAHYTNEVEGRILAQFDKEVAAVEKLVAAGIKPEVVKDVCEHIVIPEPPGTGKIHVAPEEIQKVKKERFRRLNRIGWEGVFFLAVLAAGMVVLFRAIRRDAALRRRQQNFLAAVSHEFKSPLASLRLSAETLSLRDPDAQGRERLAARMTEDIDRLETMVTNLLDTARLEEGQAPLHPERITVAEVAGSVLAAVQGHARTEKIAFTVDVDESLAVVADAHAFGTILRNLLDNAVKATASRENGVVKVSARRDGDQVRIEVEDNGVGFPPEEHKNIFRKFYRPGDELRRKSRGSGLGLYLVRRLVELHRGEVRAESEGPDRGARITLRIPAATEEKQ
jgi:signal transduction histidine kinase